MFAGLAKKKKKPKKETAADEAPKATDATGDFDASLLKKKKKKPKADADDFEAKLAKAGAAEKEEEAPQEEDEVQEGDMEKGTGIWAHNNDAPIKYNLLLERFFKQLTSHHPELMGSTKSYKIPPPQCLREGNRKTIFANIAEICRKLKRDDQHVMQFLFAELGTNGSVDGSRRLVIKGRFQQYVLVILLSRLWC
jgi:translation initiation factor 2 subunit 2